MDGISRRSFLLASSGLTAGAASLAWADHTSPADASGLQPLVIPPEVMVARPDPRYEYLNTRGLNRRFTGTPSAIYQVFTPEQAVQAVQAAVRAGQRIAVRSGGHCLDALVDNSSIRALIDVSRMNAVGYDPAQRAFAVQSGALLGDVYKQLYSAYGVVIPGGTCPTVGVGGYVPGGGFGALCRQHGLVVDHLSAVEMVVVDAAGRARLVVGSRDPADPNHDLWWSQTGAGGGSYGLVTRFFFRSPEVAGNDPASLLPRPPVATLVTSVNWPTHEMSSVDFKRLVANHGAWHAANSAAGSDYDSLYSALIVGSHAIGSISLVCEFDATVPNAAELMMRYVSAVSAGVATGHTITQSTMPWLTAAFANLYGGAVSVNNRSKGKGAYLRRPYDEEQIDTLYRYLSDPSYDGLGSVVLFSYGGKVNTVAPGATAAAQRDSILKSYLLSTWSAAADDDRHVNWVRTFYRDVHATTGGVPVPNESTDGSYINYPDIDLTDPQWNTSGIAWHDLYFKDNYPRLQRIKARYDPAEVFRHPLSVRPSA
jgi:aclacinomycin oxidase